MAGLPHSASLKQLLVQASKEARSVLFRRSNEPLRSTEVSSASDDAVVGPAAESLVILDNPSDNIVSRAEASFGGGDCERLVNAGDSHISTGDEISSNGRSRDACDRSQDGVVLPLSDGGGGRSGVSSTFQALASLSRSLLKDTRHGVESGSSVGSMHSRCNEKVLPCLNNTDSLLFLSSAPHSRSAMIGEQPVPSRLSEVEGSWFFADYLGSGETRIAPAMHGDSIRTKRWNNDEAERLLEVDEVSRELLSPASCCGEKMSINSLSPSEKMGGSECLEDVDSDTSSRLSGEKMETVNRGGELPKQMVEGGSRNQLNPNGSGEYSCEETEWDKKAAEHDSESSTSKTCEGKCGGALRATGAGSPEYILEAGGRRTRFESLREMILFVKESVSVWGAQVLKGTSFIIPVADIETLVDELVVLIPYTMVQLKGAMSAALSPFTATLAGAVGGRMLFIEISEWLADWGLFSEAVGSATSGAATVSSSPMWSSVVAALPWVIIVGGFAFAIFRGVQGLQEVRRCTFSSVELPDLEADCGPVCVVRWCEEEDQQFLGGAAS